MGLTSFGGWWQVDTSRIDRPHKTTVLHSERIMPTWMAWPRYAAMLDDPEDHWVFVPSTSWLCPVSLPVPVDASYIDCLVDCFRNQCLLMVFYFGTSGATPSERSWVACLDLGFASLNSDTALLVAPGIAILILRSKGQSYYRY